MSLETVINFTGNISRREFLRSFQEQLARLIDLQENREFFMMLKEIVKNIYDHNHGYGYARFRQITGNRIHFALGNTIFPESAEQAFFADDGGVSRVNFGLGFSSYGIKAMAQFLDIDLSFDQVAGFLFEGEYQLK